MAAPNAPDPVTVDSFTVDLGNIVDGAPNEGKLAVAGINVPGSVLKASGQGSSTITDLGYDSLMLNVGIEGSYDAAKSALTVNGITLGEQGHGQADDQRHLRRRAAREAAERRSVA